MRRKLMNILKRYRRKARVKGRQSRPAFVETLEPRHLLAQLLASWEFDDAAGSTAAQDSSGNGHPLTLSGFGTPDWVGPAAAINDNLGALYFGTDAKMGVTSNVSTLTADSIAFWIKPDQAVSPTSGSWAVAELGSVASQSLSGTVVALGPWTGSLTNEVISLVDQVSGKITTVTNVTLPAGKWSHIAFVWKSSANRYDVYINGQLKSVQSNSSGHAPRISVQNDVKIGQYSYVQHLPFAGAIDEFRLYNGSLTAAEVKTLATPFDAAAVLDTATFAGAEKYSSTSTTSVFGDEYVRVDPNKSYTLSAWGKSGADSGTEYNPNNRQYLGFASYDIDYNWIESGQVYHFPASRTRLTADLVPGAQEVKVESTSGWYSGTNVYSKALAWYGYTDSTGHTYPDYTYTRNVAFDAQGLWGDATSTGIVDATTIRLRTPWNGPTLKAGQSVANHYYSGTYNYAVLNSQAVPNQWTKYQATIGGVRTDGAAAYQMFRPGTAYIKPIMLANYQGGNNNRITWRDVEWRYAQDLGHSAGDTIELHVNSLTSTGTVTYQWSQTTGPAVQVVNANQPTAEFVAPRKLKDYDLTFGVNVSDSGTTYSDTITVHVPAAKLLAAWEFDESQGTVAQDSSGNGHPLSLSGITSSDRVAPVAENSENQYALRFGTNDKVGVTSNVSTSSAETLSFWIKPDSTVNTTSGSQVVAELGSRASDTTSGTVIALGPQTGSLTNEVITLIEQDTLQMTAIMDVSIPAGRWTHVAFAWNASANRYDAYLDGQLKIVQTYSGGHVPRISVQNDVKIGQRTYPTQKLPFVGAIDDFRIYSGSLSPDDIGSLANPFDITAVLDTATFSGSDTFSTKSASKVTFSDDFVPVDLTKTYTLTGWGKSGNDDGSDYSASNTQYFGFAAYDADYKEIEPAHVYHYPASRTRLLEDLVPGAQVIRVESTSGWYTGTSVSSKVFAWYGYTDASGHTYPDYTYTRNISYDPQGLWGAAGIENATTIRLRVPWTGPTLKAGQSVANHYSTSTYNYAVLVNQAVPNSWTKFQNTIGGVRTDGGVSHQMFRPGTAYIKALLLNNWHGKSDNRVSWRDIEWDHASSTNANGGDLLELHVNGLVPAPDGLTYQWTQLSGPNTLILDSTRSTAKISVPRQLADFNMQFRVTVGDGTSSVSDTVTVHVPAAQNYPASFDAKALLDSATFAGSESYSTKSSSQVAFGDDFVPVDLKKSYTLSGWARSGTDDGGDYSPGNKQYFGFASYDVDYKEIEPGHVYYYPTSKTRLLQDLVPGAQVIRVESTSGWYSGTDPSSKVFAWYGYTDSTGHTYPDYSYTRNIAYDPLQLWGPSGIENATTIRLRVPWAGPTLKAGQAVANHYYTSTYNYAVLAYQTVSNTWTQYQTTIGGMRTDGGVSFQMFRPGTAYIRPVLLNNWHGSADNRITWRDIEWKYSSPIGVAAGDQVDLHVDAINLVDPNFYAKLLGSSSVADRYRLGDFNGDGLKDVILLGRDGRFYVWTAQEDLDVSLKPAAYWGSDKPDVAPDRYKLGDFNGDGLTDVISFDADAGMYVWTAKSTGGFNSRTKWGANGGDIGAQRYQLGDFNGDGRTDVISFESNGGMYVWTAKTTTDGFNNYAQWGSNGGDIGPTRYKLADFTGDGRTDVISFESNGGMYVWTAKATGGFNTFTNWAFNTSDIWTERYKLADFNADGRSDVISFEANGSFNVWTAKATGGFNPKSQWGANGGDIGPDRYRLADLNGDQRPDVVSFESNGGIYAWINNSGSSFNTFSRWGSFADTTDPKQFAVGSFNSDQNADVILLQAVQPSDVWISNGAGTLTNVPSLVERPITYSWQQLSGPSVSISGADQSTAKIVAPHKHNAYDLTFRVDVTDGISTMSDTVTVHVPAVSLLAAWHFDEGQGSVVSDLSGNGRNLTLSGITAADWVGPVAENSTNAHALKFGTSSKFGTATNISTATADSISFWMKSDQVISPTSGSYVVAELGSISGVGLSGTVIALGPWTSSISNEAISLVDQVTSRMTSITNVTLSPGRWTHVAFAWNSFENRYDAYLDGQLQTVQTHSGGHVGRISVQNNVRIGQRTYSSQQLPFPGALDEFRLYNGSLSAEEVQLLASPIKATAALDATTISGSVAYSTKSANGVIFGDDFVPVDLNKTYRLSGWAKAGSEDGTDFNPNNRQYFGFASYDIDHEVIEPAHVYHYPASRTVLARDLNPGETTVYLEDASGWFNAANDPSGKVLAWYGYEDSTGHVYPDYTYTRNIAYSPQEMWVGGAVNTTTNSITLRVPWSGPPLRAGQAVANHYYTSTYNYTGIVNSPIPNAWTNYQAVISGVRTDGGATGNMFRPVTAYIKPVILANFHGLSDTRLTWRDIEWNYARPWQNAKNPFDVNASGVVTSQDLLTLVNRLNSVGYGPLPPPSSGTEAPPYYDVNGDEFFSEVDITLVQNAIAGQTTLPPQRFSPGDQIDLYSPSIPFGDTLLYQWQQTDGLPLELANSDSAITTFTAPSRGFENQHSFELNLSDGDNSVVAPVNVTIEAVPHLMRFRTEAVDAVTRTPLISAEVGQEIMLDVYVDDIRSDPSGVYSGYVSLPYDTNHLNVSDQLRFYFIYPNFISGDTLTPGIVQNAGATSNSLTGLGGGEQLLFSIPFIATAEGTVTFQLQPPTDESLYPVSLFNLDERVLSEFITYEPSTLSIIEGDGNFQSLAEGQGPEPLPAGPPAPNGSCTFGDAMTWTIDLFANPPVISENGQTSTLTVSGCAYYPVNATLSAGPNNTAVLGTDYTLTHNGQTVSSLPYDFIIDVNANTGTYSSNFILTSIPDTDTNNELADFYVWSPVIPAGRDNADVTIIDGGGECEGGPDLKQISITANPGSVDEEREQTSTLTITGPKCPQEYVLKLYALGKPVQPVRGSDYDLNGLPPGDTITFPPNVTSQTITFKAKNDTIVEDPDETATIVVAGVNDPPPTVSDMKGYPQTQVVIVDNEQQSTTKLMIRGAKDAEEPDIYYCGTGVSGEFIVTRPSGMSTWPSPVRIKILSLVNPHLDIDYKLRVNSPHTATISGDILTVTIGNQGVSEFTIFVDPLPDADENEGNEQVQLKLDMGDKGDNSSSVTIRDEVEKVKITADPSNAAEKGPREGRFWLTPGSAGKQLCTTLRPLILTNVDHPATPPANPLWQEDKDRCDDEFANSRDPLHDPRVRTGCADYGLWRIDVSPPRGLGVLKYTNPDRNLFYKVIEAPNEWIVADHTSAVIIEAIPFDDWIIEHTESIVGRVEAKPKPVAEWREQPGEATITIEDDDGIGDAILETDGRSDAECGCPCDCENEDVIVKMQDGSFRFAPRPELSKFINYQSDGTHGTRPIFRAKMRLPEGADVPQKIKLHLQIPREGQEPLIVTNQTYYRVNPNADAGDSVNIAIQANLSQYLQGREFDVAKIELVAEPIYSVTPDTNRIAKRWHSATSYLARNLSASPIAPGMTFGFLNRLALDKTFVDPYGNTHPGATLYRGDGSISFYRQSSGGYKTPPESLSSLSFVGTGMGGSDRLSQVQSRASYQLTHRHADYDLFDATGKHVAYVDTNRNVTEFNYDASDRLSSVTDPFLQTTNFGYAESFDQNNPSILIQRIVTVTDFAGRATTLRYIPGSSSATITYPDPDQTGQGESAPVDVLIYDSQKRLTNVDRRAESGSSQPVHSISFNYGGTYNDGRVLNITWSNQNNSRVWGVPKYRQQDGLPLPGTGTEGQPAEPVSEFEDLAEFIDARGNKTTYKLDHRGRVLAVTDAHNQTFEFERREVKDTFNKEYVLDRGELVKYTSPDPDDFSTRVTYGAVIPTGDDPAVLDTYNGPASSQITIYEYESNIPGITSDDRNVKKVIFPNQSVHQFKYNNAGFLEELTDEVNQVIRYGRGGGGNLESIQWQDPIWNVEGDPSNRWQNPILRADVTDDLLVVPQDALVVINALLQLGHIQLPAITEKPDNYLDTDGNSELTPLDVLQVINYLNDAPDSVAGLPFDATKIKERYHYTYTGGTNIPAGMLKQERTITGRDEGDLITTYDHYSNSANLNEFGQVSKVTYSSTNGQTSTTLATIEYTYDSNGNIATVKGRRSQTTEFTHDKLDRLTSVIGPDPDGVPAQGQPRNTLPTLVKYQYDVFDNVVGMEVVNSSTSGVLTSHVTCMRYDSLNRMTDIHEHNPDTTTTLSSITTIDGLKAYRSTSVGCPATSTGTLPSVVNGPHTNYEYDLEGNVVEATDAAGRITAYKYDPLNRPVAKVVTNPGASLDPTARAALNDGSLPGPVGGLVTKFEYDNLGNLWSVTTPDFISIHARYDDLNRLTQQIQSVIPAETASPFLPSTPRATFTLASFNYEPLLNFGWQIQQTDANLNSTHIIQDFTGRVVQTISPSPDLTETHPVTRYQYFNDGLPKQALDAMGNATDYDYDRFGRLESVKQPDPGTGSHGRPETLFTYDVDDRIKTVTDPLQRVTTYEYDVAGRLTALVLPDSTWTNPDDNPRLKYAYDSVGNLLQVTDANNNVTDYTYDSLLRLKKEILPDHPYDSLTTRPEKVFEYNSLGELRFATDEEGRKTEYQYDGVGRVSRQIAPDPDQTGSQLPSDSSLFYDAVGNLRRRQDSLTTGVREWKYGYDRLHRRTVEIDPENAHTQFEYDGVGNLLKLTDPVDNVTEWQYDDLNRKTEEIVTLNGVSDTRKYEYDLIGNLEKYTDRNGRVSTRQYDDLYRPILEQWYENDTAASNGAAPLRKLTYSYDAANQLKTLNDQARKPSAQILSNVSRFEANAYDSLGNMAGAKVNFDFAAGMPQIDSTFAYDGMSNRTQMTVNGGGLGGFTNTYQYDNRNQLKLLSQKDNGGTQTKTKVAQFAYDKSGLLTDIYRAETIHLNPANWIDTDLVAHSRYHYDGAGRLDHLTHSRTKIAEGAITPTTADAVLAEYSWTWDRANRITDAIFTGNQKVEEYRVHYAYDLRNQLKGADYTAAGGALIPPDEDYAYDENGNRTAANGKTYETPEGSYNRLKSDGVFEYEYDAEGNLIKKTTLVSGQPTGSITRYEWDHRNRLTKTYTQTTSTAPATNVIEYTYDAFDRRIGRDFDSDGTGAAIPSREVFAYDGIDVVLSFTDSDANGPQSPRLTHRYLQGGQINLVLADEVTLSNGTQFINWTLTDNLGTVRDLVRKNGSTVSVAQHHVYNSFGKQLSSTPTAAENQSLYGYAGGQNDSTTGLIYNWHRWYDPTTGRWQSQDPSQFFSGDSNLYRYASNASTVLIDENGLAPTFPRVPYKGETLSVQIPATGTSAGDLRAADEYIRENADKLFPGAGALGGTWHHKEFDPNTGKMLLELVDRAKHRETHVGAFAEYLDWVEKVIKNRQFDCLNEAQLTALANTLRSGALRNSGLRGRLDDAYDITIKMLKKKGFNVTISEKGEVIAKLQGLRPAGSRKIVGRLIKFGGAVTVVVSIANVGQAAAAENNVTDAFIAGEIALAKELIPKEELEAGFRLTVVNGCNVVADNLVINKKGASAMRLRRQFERAGIRLDDVGIIDLTIEAVDMGYSDVPPTYPPIGRPR